ncbi:MAG: hypothetical protein IJJ78_05470 [Paludibacteraceae bacterium]|nr:hypothetical protein [Paludibacteraceae bacterium]MBR0498507.1 hypothetical protein [Paludibacteraceae bacterium]
MRKILLSFIIGAFAASAFAQNPDYYGSYDFCQSLTFKNDTSVATENAGEGYMYIAPGVAPSKSGNNAGSKGPTSFTEAGFFHFDKIGLASFSVKNSNESKECIKYNITGKDGLVANGGDIIFRIEELAEGDVFAIKYSRKGTAQPNFFNSKRESAVKYWHLTDWEELYDDPEQEYTYINNLASAIGNREPTTNTDTVVNYYRVTEDIKHNPYVDLYITEAILFNVYFYKKDSETAQSMTFVVSSKDADREVVDTYYMNVAGVKSKSPFDGFNIKVDVLDDKSIRADKVFIVK